MHINYKDLTEVPVFVALAYLFNPYAVFNCVGLTTTVWSNLFLAGFFYFLVKKYTFLACVCLALETQRNFYPIVLIVPAALYLSCREVKDEDAIDLIYNTTYKLSDMLKVISIFGLVLAALHLVAFSVLNDWNFMDATYGFM